MKTQTLEELIETIWDRCDEDGISIGDRFIEPLLVHIKELEPNSDQEEDIVKPMKELVSELLQQAGEVAYKEGRKSVFDEWKEEKRKFIGGFGYKPRKDK